MADAGEWGVRVAFQGERGAFSEEAARHLLGADLRTYPQRTFEDLFQAVAQGDADCALVPIENSLAGSVHKNYDLLLEHDLTILGETNLLIVHNLIALPGASVDGLRRVYSHPVALAQCERFLRAHPQLEPIAAYDTAGSVKSLMERGRSDEAAIAGAIAAQVYGAQIVAAGIESHAQNFTRFLLLARADHAGSTPVPSPGKGLKTSIVFRLANRTGALFKALAVFALRDIDLAKIESRPIEGRPWEYSFYLDFLADVKELRAERALSHLGELAESIRILGCYPRAQMLEPGAS